MAISGEMMHLTGNRTGMAFALGIFIFSATVALNLLLENPPVVIQLEGDTFRVLEIPYVYTRNEAYMLLLSGMFGGIALFWLLISLHLLPFEPLQAENTAKMEPSKISTFKQNNFEPAAEPVFQAEAGVNENLGEYQEENISGGEDGIVRDKNGILRRGSIILEGAEIRTLEGLEDKRLLEAGISRESGSSAAYTALVLRVLEGDERKTVELIAGNGGRILQNELVNSLIFPKPRFPASL